MSPHKLTNPTDDDSPVVWGQVYRREQTTGPDRLVIAPAKSPLDLMCALAEAFGPEYFLLYVHSVARSNHEPGRYESPPLQLVDVRIFVQEFAPMLENDARHEFWIASTQNHGMLVYDEHGLIYAYGPLGEFEVLLSTQGFQEQDFSIPSPHAHHYHVEYDDDVAKLLTHWEWLRTDLRPEDER